MVPAVAQCVILDEELRHERGASAERHGAGAIELLVGELPHGGS
jgi:hypothetical protein